MESPSLEKLFPGSTVRDLFFQDADRGIGVDTTKGILAVPGGQAGPQREWR